ncbi:MAG: hypothetical protein P8Y80_01855 [Acidobacteriota bacterium]
MCRYARTAHRPGPPCVLPLVLTGGIVARRLPPRITECNHDVAVRGDITQELVVGQAIVAASPVAPDQQGQGIIRQCRGTVQGMGAQIRPRLRHRRLVTTPSLFADKTGGRRRVVRRRYRAGKTTASE